MTDTLIVVLSDGTTFEPVEAGATIYSASQEDIRLMMEQDFSVEHTKAKHITKLPRLYSVSG